MPPLRTLSRSEADTFAAGRRLANRLSGGDVVLLIGELGMGKTAFARGVAAGLGVDPGEVRSPTFTLVNPYHGRLPVHHVDLYRIERSDELEEIGIRDILAGDGVAIIEWAERLGPYRPASCIEVRIEDRGGTERLVTVSGGEE